MPSDTAAVAVHDLTWRPAGRRAPTLRDVTLRVAPGERVLLAGPSGAGKSTLLRAIAGVLEGTEPGECSGLVEVAGAPAGTVPGAAGLVLQEPGDAIVAGTVGRDVAFGPENLALARPHIWQRVSAVLEATGFPYGPARPTSALSGGEAQRLALAGALALTPTVLLLDEPTSMLDPPAAATVRAAVRDVLAGSDAALVVVDHDLGPWLDQVDRIVVLGANGQVVADGPAGDVLARRGDELAAQGLWVPGMAPPAPVAVPERVVAPWEALVTSGTPVVQARGVVARHRTLLRMPEPPPPALDGVDADLVAGRVLAITGHSGSGKSTLAGILAGLDGVDAGTVTAAGALADRRGRRTPRAWRSPHLARHVAWVPQSPEIAVVERTVRDDVLAAARAVGRDATTAEERADVLLDVLGLRQLAQADPHQLSGGETRRLALAGALAHGPTAVLLDEPTVGQDRDTWAVVAGLVAATRRAGTAVGLATHDRLAVETLADDELTLEAGRAVTPAVPR